MPFNESRFKLAVETANDAEEVVAFFNKIGGETDFIPFGLNEYQRSVAGHIEALKGRIGFVVRDAENGGVVVAHGMSCSKGRRCSHVYELGIAVRKDCWRLGIGAFVMEKLAEVTKRAGGEKLMVIVDTKNEAGVKLYEKLGYEKEGHMFKDVRVSASDYRDVFIMCKYIS